MSISQSKALLNGALSRLNRLLWHCCIQKMGIAVVIVTTPFLRCAISHTNTLTPHRHQRCRGECWLVQHHQLARVHRCCCTMHLHWARHRAGRRSYRSRAGNRGVGWRVCHLRLFAFCVCTLLVMVSLFSSSLVCAVGIHVCCSSLGLWFPLISNY